VTTPFTFFATAGAIARLGAVPMFCDIDPVTYNISPDKLDDLLVKEIEDRGNTRIKAILPVHLYGQCADMNDLLALAEKFQLPIVEDAAQAVGTDYPAAEGVKRASAMGTLGTLSFFPSKNLGAFGDGGMVLTQNKDLSDKLKLLRGHGSSNKYFYKTLGGNFRLDALQAAILRVKLKHLDSWIQSRKKKADYYDGLIRTSGLVEKELINYPRAIFREMGIQNYHTYHQYVIRAEKRDELQAFLKQKGIASAIYYPLSLHLQECFSYLGYVEGDFPESEKASKEVLALPIYPELTQDQQEEIVRNIQEFFSGQ